MAANLTEIDVGFIGGGAMAEAIFRGLILSKSVAASKIRVLEIFPPRRDALEAMDLGITIVSSPEDLLPVSKIVILATKPDAVPQALASCKARWTMDTLLISICAGVKMDAIVSAIGLPTVRAVRAMPNLPCLVNESATGLFCNSFCSKGDVANALAVMTSCGMVEQVPEKLMDAVTGFSGSGPGFVFMFIEALADAAVLNGLPRMTARKLAAQVVYGSAKMILEDPQTHPGEFRNRVESPGGTTIAGTQAMEAAGFRSAIVAGVTTATKRSEELGKK